MILSIVNRQKQSIFVKVIYDGGKKIKGRKWHIVVDPFGHILSIVIRSATTDDSMGAEGVLEELIDMYLSWIKKYLPIEDIGEN